MKNKEEKEYPSWISNLMLGVVGVVLIFMLIFSIKIKINEHNVSNNIVENTTNAISNNISLVQDNTVYTRADNTQFVISRGGDSRVDAPIVQYLLYNFKVNGETVLCFDNQDTANERKSYLESNTEGLEISIEQFMTVDNSSVSTQETIDNTINNYVTEYQEKKAQEEAERKAAEEKAAEEARQAELAKTHFPTISHNISSSYGYRSRGDFHTGIDLAGNYGDSVYAYKAGTVEKTQYSNVSYGNMVLIRHSDGTKTRYAHLSSILVSQGQSVSCGETIGKVGSTGNSTGNHLHFEIIINGNTVNPYNYIF